MTEEEPIYRTPQRWINGIGYASTALCVFLSFTQEWWTGLAAWPVCLTLGVVACRIVRP